MLALLVGPYFLLTALGQLRSQEYFDYPTRGCLGLSLVFCFTGIGHFIQSKAMAEMLPPFIPSTIPLVLGTGVLELVAAIAISIPTFRLQVGWGLALMLVLFMPINVYAAVNRVGMGGHEWGPI